MLKACHKNGEQMKKQVNITKVAGNIIHADFRRGEQKHPAMAELLRSSDDTDMAIGYHWERKEYAKAVELAQKGNAGAVKTICDDGILHLHRLLGHIRRDRKIGFQGRRIFIGTVYGELAKLHGARGNSGAAEAFQHLSKAALGRDATCKE